jgi:hypothetical protein
MHNYIELGSAPVEENCVCVSDKKDYIIPMREECNRYKELLQRKFPDRPNGVIFAVKKFYHDFGSYLEVVVKYDDENEEQVNYAYMVESNLPGTWNS